MMRAKSLKSVIDFVLKTPDVIEYIKTMESKRDTFAIHQVAAFVVNHKEKVIQVTIDFVEKNNPHHFKEDIVIEVQGTNAFNFKLLSVTSYEGK